MDKINDKYLKILYKLAYKAYKKGEIPVGSIIIYNNKIIGMGYNNKESNNNVCGHAEINAITNASKYMKDWRLNECMLLTTLKPCEMCNEVIKASRIKDVYYLLDQNNLKYNSNYKQISIESNNKYLVGYTELFNDFFKNIRN